MRVPRGSTVLLSRCPRPRASIDRLYTAQRTSPPCFGGLQHTLLHRLSKHSDADLTFGIPAASGSSTNPWAMTNLWRASSKNGWQRSGNCGEPSHPSQICNVKPLLFRSLVLERLRLLLSITGARCACGVSLDSRGQHRAACPRSGRARVP